MKLGKVLVIFFALILMAGLLSAGQTVFAYNSGDISGTTGSGKKDDPIMVDSFSELREACALASFGTHLYIELENKTVTDTLPFDAPTLTSAIGLNTGYVHLILNGSYVFKANHIEKSLYGELFEVRSGGSLEISGNGKISFSPMLTAAVNAVVKVNGGTVEINSGHLDGHPLNWRTYGRAISYSWGKLTINNGVFTGYSDQAEPDTVDAITIVPPSSVSNNSVVINGGTFSSASRVAPTTGNYGLTVWGASTYYDKYEIIKLSGGTFDGIGVDVNGAVIGDLLEEGYNTYYDSGALAKSVEKMTKTSDVIIIQKPADPIIFINDIAFTVTAPVVGNSPATTATASSNLIKINQVSWLMDDTYPQSSTDVFKAGHKYLVWFFYSLNDGVELVPGAKISVNGKPATIVESYRIGYEFVLEGIIPISSVSLTVTEPKAGAKPDFNPVLPSGAGCDIGSVAWFDETGEHWMSSTESFAAGHSYTVRVDLLPKDGYEFDLEALFEGDIAKVNGKDADSDLRDSEDGDYLRVRYTFPAVAASVKIGDVNQDGSVDATDRMILSRYLAKWDGYAAKIKSMDAADIDRNGKVEAKDRMILARYLAGWTGYDQYFK